MQTPQRQGLEVVINGSQGKTTTPTGRLRPLTVDEALQYSPMTTSLTSGCEHIPLPQLGQPTALLGLTTEKERLDLRKTLDPSPKSSSTSATPFAQYEFLRTDLDDLLNPDQLSEFKFKSVQVPRRSSKSDPASKSASVRFEHHISPLAKMVLDSSDIGFRYSPPTTPNPKASSYRQFLPTPALSESPEEPIATRNDRYFQLNSKHQPLKHEIMIEVPPRLPYSYGELPNQSPKRRKLNSDQPIPQVAIHYRAQKEEAEVALSKFQDFLLEIFDAFDRSQPDTSNSIAQPASQYFEEVDFLDSSAPVLTSKVHSKLQNAAKKLITSGKFKQLPPDDVRRLQRICEAPIIRAQAIDLHADQDLTDESLSQWRDSIAIAENGLTSACTLGWTILGSLENKELCPEDIVQYIPILLTNAFENCLIPVVEARSSGRTSDLFKLASGSRDLLTRLLHQGRKLLTLVADMCLQMDSTDSTSMIRIEYLATQLIFVESSHTEKDSALGVQLYETVRKTAMEALAKIFSRFVDQRQSILDEILSSLQKLSTTKQGARQFKLVDGKNIQLVSALVMQLVQTVASETSKPSQRPQITNPAHSHRADLGSESSEDEERSDKREDEEGDRSVGGISSLNQKSKLLYQRAVESASYIINYFVQRAKVSTKTGDQPHRNLLDLFTQDLISVLPSPDWPAAELLLWVLARHMLAILSDDKSTATPKNMALEILGWMGSAISTLLISLKSLCDSLDRQSSSVGRYLADLAEDQLRGSFLIDDIVTETGPFRITLEHLKNCNQDSWQTRTAQGYYLTVWAKSFSSKVDNGENGENGENGDQKELQEFSRKLLKALNDPNFLFNQKALEEVSPHQGRLAYLLTIMNMGFCKAFDVIVKALLQSLTSDQAKMRSRSLKSVIAMLEADPKLLERDAGVVNVMFRCASDPSPMVRDNALSLIAKSVSLTPGLEEEAARVIMERAQSDVATGVRKRCITILKEIYQRNSKNVGRADIARSFLYRLSDAESAVALLAQQTLFDIWLAPFLAAAEVAADSAKTQVAVIEQVDLIVQIITATEGNTTHDLLSHLEQFYRTVLQDKTKSHHSVSVTCSNLVDTLFDLVLNSSERTTKQEQRALLSSLEVFAKADSTLVKPEQLQALQPYIQNLSTDDDLFLFRSVVVVYRCVLPQLSDSSLLKAIQNDLMRAVSKLGRSELNEAVSCLWTIDRVLRNTERLVKLTMSLLKHIYETKIPALGGQSDGKAVSDDVTRRLRSYLRIAGAVGKHCDLELFANSFREVFPSWKGTSVVSLMVDLVAPLTNAERPPLIRTEALHCLASICQAWPGQLSKEIVRKSFADVLEKGSPDLQHIVVTSFLEFFKSREIASEILATGKNGNEGAVSGRLDSSLKASDHDGAAALIAQNFLTSILQVSMSGNEQNDMPALQVIASINRQGLVHPKECIGALVALETSPRPTLAKIASDCHQLLHQQHETMLEREYMRAIRDAYIYQRDIIKDSAGSKTRPFVPKLSSLFDIVKTSNTKYVRKFLRNLVTRIGADGIDLPASSEICDQAMFSKFLLQNLAHWEYGKLDELNHAISCMESLVGRAGADITQAVETQIIRTTEESGCGLGQSPRPPSSPQVHVILTPAAVPPVMDSTLLRRLTVSAMTLTMVWETRTHLRRQYGVTGAVREGSGKSHDAKELARPPAKVHGITGERYWESVSEIMTSLDNEGAMLSRCRAFVQLMTVDDEVKVAADGDEMRESYSASLDPESGLQPPVNGTKGSRSKQRSSASAPGTPRKKGGRSGLSGKRRSSANLDSEDD